MALYITETMPKFWVNENYDMTKIVDSMEIDSDETIASLDLEGYTADLMVRGEVKVFWNENGIEDCTDAECYKYPSEFPKELKDLIHNDKDWECDPRVNVDFNNWFELFVEEPDGYRDAYDVVDAAGKTPDDLYDMLREAIIDCRNRREWEGIVRIMRRY